MFFFRQKAAPTPTASTSSNSIDAYSSIPSNIPKYHELSSLRSREGYFPNISNGMLVAVNKLKSMLNEAKIDINIDEENEFLKLLRFLRARQFNTQKAFDMIKSDMEWRESVVGKNLRSLSAQEVLDCDIAKISKYFPTWIQGYDKEFRPVSYRNFGASFVISDILQVTSMERLIKFHAWESEQALRLMHEKSKSTGYNIETFICVIDAAGWNMQLATSDAFTFIKAMVTTDSDHYPERLGQLIIINAPSMLAWAWRIIQTFLDNVTKAKIQIYGNDKSVWQSKLFEIINEDQIPECYGGSAKVLESISSMNY